METIVAVVAIVATCALTTAVVAMAFGRHLTMRGHRLPRSASAEITVDEGDRDEEA